MRSGLTKGKPPHLDYDPKVENRMVYNLETGEFKKPPNKSQLYIQTISLPWISEATQLPYSALRVGLACWFMDGCNKQKPFTLSRATSLHFSIAKWDKQRGLKQLENAGLIEIQRQPGRLSLISLRHNSPQTEGDPGRS
jgi:hypothetical protein